MKTSLLFAAGLALSYLVIRKIKASRHRSADVWLDDEIEDSFPASDPPSHTGAHI
jgi:hypothetical protein